MFCGTETFIGVINYCSWFAKSSWWCIGCILRQFCAENWKCNETGTNLSGEGMIIIKWIALAAKRRKCPKIETSCRFSFAWCNASRSGFVGAELCFIFLPVCLLSWVCVHVKVCYSVFLVYTHIYIFIWPPLCVFGHCSTSDSTTPEALFFFLPNLGKFFKTAILTIPNGYLANND